MMDYAVGKSTVSDWKKKRAEIKKWCANQESTSNLKLRKNMRKGLHFQVDEALYLWFQHGWSENQRTTS